MSAKKSKKSEMKALEAEYKRVLIKRVKIQEKRLTKIMIENLSKRKRMLDIDYILKERDACNKTFEIVITHEYAGLHRKCIEVANKSGLKWKFGVMDQDEKVLKFPGKK